MSKLKPCPFCKGGVDEHQLDDHLAANGCAYINCWNCFLEMSEAYLIERNGKARAKKKLNKRWNTRIDE